MSKEEPNIKFGIGVSIYDLNIRDHGMRCQFVDNIMRIGFDVIPKLEYFNDLKEPLQIVKGYIPFSHYKKLVAENPNKEENYYDKLRTSAKAISVTWVGYNPLKWIDDDGNVTKDAIALLNTFDMPTTLVVYKNRMTVCVTKKNERHLVEGSTLKTIYRVGT